MGQCIMKMYIDYKEVVKEETKPVHVEGEWAEVTRGVENDVGKKGWKKEFNHRAKIFVLYLDLYGNVASFFL